MLSKKKHDIHDISNLIQRNEMRDNKNMQKNFFC